MGTSLSGLTPQNTYRALLKTADNSALSTTVKAVSDGQGNETPFRLATDKVEIGDVSYAEIQRLNGVTSDIQTQLDSKVDENVAITGATKTKITYDAKGLVTSGADATTADIAASTDKNYVTDAQAVVIGNTSGTNTGDNATNSQYSGLAAQIALKSDKLITTNRQTASYTLVLGDADKLVEMNVAGANNLTIPPNSSVAFSIGAQTMIAQYGAGETTIVAGPGVTIRSSGGKLKLNVQYAGATLIKIATDEWYLFGEIKA